MEATFYPLYLYLITKELISFYLIIKNDNTSKTEKGNNDINLNNIHSFWDYRKDEFLISAIKFLIATTIWGLIYGLIRKIPNLKLKEYQKKIILR